MKRVILTLLVLTLCLSGTAFASTPVDNVVLAVNDGNFCIYVGANNYLYRSDSVAPVVEVASRSVLYADASTIVFSTVDEEHQQDYIEGASVLWSYDLANAANEPEPRSFANIIGEAVYLPADSAIYFVGQDNDNLLESYSPFQGGFSDAVDFHTAITGLSASVNGLVVYTDSTAYLYNAAQGQVAQLDVADAPQDGSIKAYANFETRLDGSGNLSVCPKGTTDGTPVDTGVAAVTAASNIVYYIRTQDSAVQLCAYNFAANTSTVLYSFTETMLPEMVSDGTDTIYMLGSSFAVYRYSASTGVTEQFYTIENVTAPVLFYAVPSLLVYEGSTADGTERFVTGISTTPSGVDSAQPEVLGTPEPYEAPTVETTAAPAAPVVVADNHPDLTKGSRGDDVSALQQVLKNQGYPVGKVDGIFGAGTRKCVYYLQGDMGLSETGVVSYQWLTTLQSETDLPTFTQYKQVKRGDTGIRVSDMQSRLKSLGWLSGSADGDFGKSTESAVKNFQAAAGLSKDGVAGVHTLKALFAKDAPKYTKPKEPSSSSDSSDSSDANPDYVDDGYIVDMVRWMNNNDPSGKSYSRKTAIKTVQYRLVQLGYMDDSQVTTTYDEDTWLAVKRFQNDNDLLAHPTGNPDITTLAALFGL